jgi:hypothetical protein
VEEPARRIAEMSQWFGCKHAGIEGIRILPGIRIDLQGTAKELRRIQQVVIDAVTERTEER